MQILLRLICLSLAFLGFPVRFIPLSALILKWISFYTVNIVGRKAWCQPDNLGAVCHAGKISLENI
jgi:hypothetical protein